MAEKTARNAFTEVEVIRDNHAVGVSIPVSIGNELRFHNPPLRAVDLFAGCGGLSKGFENAGVDIRAAFEFWDAAADVYELNFNHKVLRVDLGKERFDRVVDRVKGYHPDIIMGGPPCQDFSSAGKRIEAGRAELTETFANIVVKVQPRYFVMENVPRARTSVAYNNALNTLHSKGYGLTLIVLDASHCGVSQKRKRLFCIGIRGGMYNDSIILHLLTSRQNDEEMTLRKYLGKKLDFEYYYRHPRNYNRRAVFSVDEPSPTVRGINRPMPKGYPGNPNDATTDKALIHNLTTLDRAAIQTFPATYKWQGTKTALEQMIGNAVPVKLAEFVAKALVDYDRATETPNS